MTGSGDLRRRLAQFDRLARRRRTHMLTDVPATAATGRLPLDALMATTGAHWVGEPPTGYLRVERAIAADVYPGAPAAVVPPRAWEHLTGTPHPGGGRWVVVDTETTGLAGGAGTLIFLVGVVLWDEDGARLVQYFMPEPAGERALLEDVWADLEPATAYLSFNGRAFDVPRLSTRGRLQRLRDDLLQRPHLDLLHPSRRLAREWLPDCRLGTLEEHLLGIPREDDMPGADVPEVYQLYLTEGVDVGLAQVLEHNRQDVESLLLLAAFLSECFLGRERTELPASAHLGLARALESRGALGEATARYATAGSCGEEEDDGVARRALWGLACCHRRQGDVAQARQVFEQMTERWPAWVEPRIEMAKLLEHRVGDFRGAARMVRSALDLVELRAQIDRDESAGGPSARMREELLHRLARVERRGRNITPLRQAVEDALDEGDASSAP